MKIHELYEDAERYTGVIEPNSRSKFGQTIQLEKPIRAYHATHENIGLVLTNREIKTYDSMGTWLSSDPEMVKTMYGPNVGAYMIPPGKYLLAKRSQDFWELVLNCLPIIEKHVGKGIADHLAKYPLTGQNHKFLIDARKMARAKIEEIKANGGTPACDTVDGMIIELWRWKDKDKLNKYKMLQKSIEYYRDVCLNKDYCIEYRELLERSGIQGIIWNKRKWDNSPNPHTIFLVFHKEDLKPIPTLNDPDIELVEHNLLKIIRQDRLINFKDSDKTAKKVNLPKKTTYKGRSSEAGSGKSVTSKKKVYSVIDKP